MNNIEVHRYDEGVRGFAGWIEPEDKSWIAFIERETGYPVFFLDRDPETGAIR